MGERIENIISYVLGGITGLAIGYIILSLNVPFLVGIDRTLFLVIACLVGILISVTFQHHRTLERIKHNTELKDEIVALITHEMRTGLTSTNWAIQLVLEKYGRGIREDDVKMLTGVVRSIETTVMHSVNLLDVSLLEIEKLAISRAWMNLGEVQTVIKEVLEKYEFGAHRKGVTLTSSVELDPKKEVEVDIMRVRIVLENLLENAIQYADGGQKLLTVKVDNDAKNMNIMVKDTGIGIPKSEQPKIFSEFYRASNARKKLSSGSGIGLYMAKKYIAAHKGTIRFESEENKGTTFYITLPLRTAEDVDEFLTKV